MEGLAAHSWYMCVVIKFQHVLLSLGVYSTTNTFAQKQFRTVTVVLTTQVGQPYTQ